MQKASKVFIILTMVFLPLILFGGLGYYIATFWVLIPVVAPEIPIMQSVFQNNFPQYGSDFFFLIRRLLLILAIMMTLHLISAYITGIIGMRKMKTATSKRQMLPYSIMVLLFNNYLSGILLLCTPACNYNYYIKRNYQEDDDESDL